MFNRILLPLDRAALAECVLPHAIAVARAFESQVTLLHVMDTPREARWRRAMDPLNWQIRKAEATTYLNEVDLRLQAAGLLTETHILEGFAAEQVIGFSDTHASQLIIMSSHGQSGLSEWGVSSVVQKIVLRARTSVMIVRAAQPVTPEPTDLRYQRILVPMDGSQRAEYILPAAATLARAHDAQIVADEHVGDIQFPPQLGHLMPKWFENWMYPVNKTDLDVLRFAHFLALAAEEGQGAPSAAGPGSAGRAAAPHRAAGRSARPPPGRSTSSATPGRAAGGRAPAPPRAAPARGTGRPGR